MYDQWAALTNVQKIWGMSTPQSEKKMPLGLVKMLKKNIMQRDNMSLKCRNESCFFELSYMQSPLGHSWRLKQTKQLETYQNEEELSQECGDCTSEEPTMDRTNGDDVLQEISVTVRKLVQERKNQLNDEEINRLIQTKITWITF